MVQIHLMDMGLDLAIWQWQFRRSGRYIDHNEAVEKGMPLILARILYWLLDALIFVKDLIWQILYAFFWILVIRLVYTLTVVALYLALFYFILYLIFS